MNVWDLITNASSLPVQVGINLWQHINNLKDVIHSHTHVSQQLNIQVTPKTSMIATSMQHQLISTQKINSLRVLRNDTAVNVSIDQVKLNELHI